MKRMMGLDYGSKTVGVAISDELGMTAQAHETIYRKEENKLRRTLARIEKLVIEYDIGTIVLGKPLHMDDSEGERVEYCKVFKEMLERRTGLEVLWQDERLSSYEAGEILLDSGVKKGEIKKYIDSVAAAIILKDYMGNNN